MHPPFCRVVVVVVVVVVGVVVVVVVVAVVVAEVVVVLLLRLVLLCLLLLSFVNGGSSKKRFYEKGSGASCQLSRLLLQPWVTFSMFSPHEAGLRRHKHLAGSRIVRFMLGCLASANRLHKKVAGRPTCFFSI